MALIIKSLGVDTPNYDELSDDEDDFVKDPAQYRAVLPQPYRFVDEVLSLFIDDVWEEITFKENEKAAERSKVRPPKYECAVQMPELTSAKAMTASSDGRYLFVATVGGLSVLDASKKKVLHTHNDEHLDLHTLVCCIIGVEIYLLVAIDEQGVCNMFVCVNEKLLVMKVLNEEAANKLHVTKCQPSPDGDYLGLVLENPSNSDITLEVYSLPRDVWLKEVEDAKSKMHESEESKKVQEVSQPGEQETEVSEASPTADRDEVILSGRKSADSIASKQGYIHKFTMAHLIMRQHRPEKLQANPAVSASTALKELSDPKHLLGSGQGHLLSRPYTQIREQSFDELHKCKIMYKMEDSLGEINRVECNFHFFTPGLAIPYGIEQPGALKKAASIGVWWSGSSQFIYYSLTRPVKVKKAAADAPDAELDIKPETVWPQAAVITGSATSPESALVAIGLQNGLVTIWDKYLCSVRKSVLVSKCAITKLDFMEPSICPQSNNAQESYPTSTSCYVLVRCADSSLHLLNCGPRDISPPITVSAPAVNDDHTLTAVHIFPSKCAEVIMKVFKNGTMFLQDVISTKTICEISLPSTYELTSPWQPVMSISAYGQMLYITGTQKEEELDDKIQTSLFVFQFRSFPALDSYWIKSRRQLSYLTMSHIDTRISALLTQRVKTSEARQQRLQRRWPLMKQEALKIAQIRSH